MRIYSVEELKKEYNRLNYKWFDFHFVGIRSEKNEANLFDDTFGVINGNDIKWFLCTTNAGTHWLLNLMNPKGTAHLKPGQYIDTWAFGLHQKKYRAFVQVKPVEVYRDANKNKIAEESNLVDRGLFGINIHRANENIISKFIDKWSAGCQVIPNPSDFKLILSMAERSQLNNFTYTLLKEF